MRERWEEREWRRRRGRFVNCDEDTPDQRQVLPGVQPSVSLQTHGKDYHDGATEGVDS